MTSVKELKEINSALLKEIEQLQAEDLMIDQEIMQKAKERERAFTSLSVLQTKFEDEKKEASRVADNLEKMKVISTSTQTKLKNIKTRQNQILTAIDKAKTWKDTAEKAYSELKERIEKETQKELESVLEKKEEHQDLVLSAQKGVDTADEKAVELAELEKSIDIEMSYRDELTAKSISLQEELEGISDTLTSLKTQSVECERSIRFFQHHIAQLVERESEIDKHLKSAKQLEEGGKESSKAIQNKYQSLLSAVKQLKKEKEKVKKEKAATAKKQKEMAKELENLQSMERTIVLRLTQRGMLPK
ncbi:hypothetical protein ADUPG1_013053 [Aduncisulcus paluster]|uniref:Uncharacterized protein n=1 Tax=Aduncisulcus paluster TaxID=2918883 RepID=A0ABQ5K6D0_9EUKA|nr:hypothetical protein ADUPG1_013053 [Aduncisulcus paluster]